MGFMTIVSILNDGWHLMKANPEQFMANIEKGMRDWSPGGSVRDYPIGNFCNPMEVRRSFHADQSVLLLAGQNSLEDLADFDPTRKDAFYLAYKARAMHRAAAELEYANRLLQEKLSEMVVQDMKARNLDKSKIKDTLKTYEAYRVMSRKEQNAVAKMVEKALAKMEASGK